MTRQIEFATDEIYHIYNRGTEKRKIYTSSRDYERFLALLYLCNQKDRIDERIDRRNLREVLELPRGQPLVDVATYCLMPNHFHLILREISGSGVSRFMQKLITGYTMYFNTRYKRSGALFQGKFKAVHARDDRYLKYLIAYVHLNPIELTTAFETDKLLISNKMGPLRKYQYSSYLDFIGKKRPENQIINVSALPGYFSSPAQFKSHIRDWLEYADVA